MPHDLSELQKAVAEARKCAVQPWWVKPLRILGALQMLFAGAGLMVLLGAAVSIFISHQRTKPAPERAMPAVQPAAEPAGQQGTGAPGASADEAAHVSPARQGPGPTAIDRTVSVGQWRYTVHTFEWARAIDTAAGGQAVPRAGTRFLVVRLTAWNTGNVAAVLPPARLRDPAGTLHEPVAGGDAAAPAATEALGPHVPHDVTVSFEVAPGQAYTLVLSGGWLSDSTAEVELRR